MCVLAAAAKIWWSYVIIDLTHDFYKFILILVLSLLFLEQWILLKIC